jgi:nitrite reductase (NO-forming)
LCLLGILTGGLGRAAELPLIYRVVQGPGMASSPQDAPKSPATEYVPNIRFRLRTALADGKLAFVGVGGDLDGVVNPTLRFSEGAVVQIDLLNDDGIEHDLSFPDLACQATVRPVWKARSRSARRARPSQPRPW